MAGKPDDQPGSEETPDWEKRNGSIHEGMGVGGMLLGLGILSLIVITLALLLSMLKKGSEEESGPARTGNAAPSATASATPTTAPRPSPTRTVMPVIGRVLTPQSRATAVKTPTLTSAPAASATVRTRSLGLTTRFERKEERGTGMPSSVVPGEYVTAVVKGGPAAAAGLKAGDLIVEVNGKQLWAAKEFWSRINASTAGQVSIRVLRQGRPVDLTLDSGGP